MDGKQDLLVTRARRGDQDAFTQLVELYQRPVFNLCYRMLGNPGDAEDAAQETFIRAYTRLGSFDANRKFSSWLLAIAAHYCIDQLRRRRFKMVAWDDLPAQGDMADDEPQPEEVTQHHDLQRQVRALLNELPPEYRAAVTLRYWSDLSYEEIAEALQTTTPAIKSRLFRARQLMMQAAANSPLAPARTSTATLPALGPDVKRPARPVGQPATQWS